MLEEARAEHAMFARRVATFDASSDHAKDSRHHLPEVRPLLSVKRQGSLRRSALARRGRGCR